MAGICQADKRDMGLEKPLPLPQHGVLKDDAGAGPPLAHARPTARLDRAAVRAQPRLLAGCLPADVPGGARLSHPTAFSLLAALALVGLFARLAGRG